MFLRKPLTCIELFGIRTMCLMSQDAIALHQFNKKSVKFFMKNLGFTKLQTHDIFVKNPNLHTVDLDRLQNAHQVLLQYGYTKDVIKKDPNILTTSPATIEQHIMVLQESGFKNIDTTSLRSYLTLIRKPISLLKAYQYLDDDLNVVDHILKYLDSSFVFASANKVDDSLSLGTIRSMILHEYLQWYLQISENEVDHLFKTYSRIKNKCFQLMTKALKQLEEIGFTKERIKRNGFLLYSHPYNNEKILTEIPELAGLDIKEVLQKCPKIMMTNYSTLIKTHNHLKDFNISNEAMRRCWDIFTLSSDTVYERLQDLNSIPEFKVMARHPRVLRLVHYQKKALSRLSYLQEMKVRCASLHVLSSTRDEFEKYAKEGADRTKGKDLVSFLMSVFNLSSPYIRECLNRHNFWCHVPVTTAEQTLLMLKQRSFLDKHLIHNLHILLYPKLEVEKILNELSSSRTHPELPTVIDLTTIENEKILSLCMYILEKKHHFTGNGIWTEDVNDQPITIDINSPLPQETLGKNINYRYLLNK